MFSTVSHTPEADLYEDRNGVVPPIAETLAPIPGRDVETAAAAFHSAATAYLQTWSARAAAAAPAADTVAGSAVTACASALSPGTGSRLDAAGAAASVLLQPATVLTWHLLLGPQTGVPQVGGEVAPPH